MSSPRRAALRAASRGGAGSAARVGPVGSAEPCAEAGGSAAQVPARVPVQACDPNKHTHPSGPWREPRREEGRRESSAQAED